MVSPRDIATAIADALPGRGCTGRVASEDFGALFVHVKDADGERIGHLTVRSDGTVTESLERRGPELLDLARAVALRLV